MPNTLIKPRLQTYKHKPKNKPQTNNTESNITPHLQSLEQNLLSGNGFVVYKQS